MRRLICFILILFMLLSGCSQTPQQSTTIHTPTQRNSFKLPPTWTPTGFIQPSETSTQPAKLTFTPLPSVTPLPPTLTISPTSDLPTQQVTPTVKPTLVKDCDVWTMEEGVFLHSVPYDEPFSLLPTMIPSTTYKAISYHPTFYQLMLNANSVGWADYRLPTLNSEGPGCSDLPLDNREIYQYSNLCFFTTDNRSVDVYRDQELTVYADTISGTTAHRILLRYEDVYYSNDGVGTPNFFVDASQVRTFGACRSVPKAGEIIAETWLWSQPNAQLSEKVVLMPEGSQIAVQEGPVQGPKPPDASGSGYWYLVMGAWNRDNAPHGWIWSSFFDFE